MTKHFEDGVEDIHQAASAGRAIRPHGPYGILVGREGLDFSPVVINDPVPTGAQILGAAGVQQAVEHLLFQMLQDGLLEEIRPEETVDLRETKARKFLIFRSDRSFRFQLDDRAFDWGAALISGATLKRLAGVDSVAHDVWQDVRGGTDKLIADADFVDLAAPGVERFFTAKIEVTIVVNTRPKQVHQRTLSYWEVVKLAFPEAAPNADVNLSLIHI